MKREVLFFTLVIGAFVTHVQANDDNPCNGGELFGLVCKMLQVFQKNAAEGNKQLEDKFNHLLVTQKNSRENIRNDFQKDLQKIKKKQKDDVQMLIELIEVKINDSSALLRHKNNEYVRDLENRYHVIDKQLLRMENHILKFENNVKDKFQKVTSINEKNLEKLENEIEENEENLKSSLHSEKLQLENAINTKVTQVQAEFQGKINSIQNQMTSQLKQTETQIQDLYNKVKNELEIKYLQINVQLQNNILKFQKDIKDKLQSTSSINDGNIKNLEKKFDDNQKKLKNSFKSEKMEIEKTINTKVTNIKTDFQGKINNVQSKLTTNSQKTKSQIQDLYNKVNQVKEPKWPSGSYCILQNGGCPAGFSSYSGYMRAINMYSGTGVYIKQGSFGNSKIQCHGACVRNSNWIGELYIVACCK